MKKMNVFWFYFKVSLRYSTFFMCLSFNFLCIIQGIFGVKIFFIIFLQDEVLYYNGLIQNTSYTLNYVANKIKSRKVQLGLYGFV